ncbi:hypothetical protein HHI36_018727 [Cryptolaemus montrouzieri]|uniref:Kazal-like domain-containing protein n=1 Tax=Cryptolaemus montrouzieri TaxID=559131 RepID=A0ABD2P1Z2_9CUCU
MFKFIVLFIALFVILVNGAPAEKGVSPAFTTCTKACQTNYHLNPVCGTDGQSYPNEDTLRCYNRCGQTVQVASKGFCKKHLPPSQRE